MKSARVAKQNGQQAARFRQDADASLNLIVVSVHYIIPPFMSQLFTLVFH